MKARGALWAIGLFAAATACDNGNPAKVPEGQKTAIVTRQISGISDELLGVSAQNMSLDSSATSLTMVCPCYFGSKYMLDEMRGPVMLVVAGTTIILRTIPGADYTIRLEDRTVETRSR